MRHITVDIFRNEKWERYLVVKADDTFLARIEAKDARRFKTVDSAARTFARRIVEKEEKEGRTWCGYDHTGLIMRIGYALEFAGVF